LQPHADGQTQQPVGRDVVRAVKVDWNARRIEQTGGNVRLGQVTVRFDGDESLVHNAPLLARPPGQIFRPEVTRRFLPACAWLFLAPPAERIALPVTWPPCRSAPSALEPRAES